MRDAGLEDAAGVRGEYVPGEGWKVERSEPDADGWFGYAPLDTGQN